MMLSRKNSRREKEQPADLDWHIRDLRTQLSEQIAFVEGKCECECSMLRELNDFFRKRAEIEAVYARSLDKLARTFASRQRAAAPDVSSGQPGTPDDKGECEPQKDIPRNVEKDKDKDQNEAVQAKRPAYSTLAFWTESVADARRTASDHAALGELFERGVASRCVELAEGVQRAAKHWRTALNESYEHTVRAVADLQLALRTYQAAFAEYAAAGAKLTDMHARGDRIATQLSLRLYKRKHSEPLPASAAAAAAAAAAADPAGGPGAFVQRAICGTSNLPVQTEPDEHYGFAQGSENDQPAQAQLGAAVLKRVGASMQKKVKAFERELGKKQSKCAELRSRAMRARNEYVLSLEACNAQLVRLQHDCVAELLDALHVGYHGTLRRLALLHASAERGVARAAERRADALRRCSTRIDARADQRCMLRQPAFARTRQFHFQAAREDDQHAACLIFCSTAPSRDSEHRKSLTGEDCDLEPLIEQEMVQRAVSLKRRVEELRADAEEDCKTVEASERSLLDSFALPITTDDQESLDIMCKTSTISSVPPNGSLCTAGTTSLTALSGSWTVSLGESRKHRPQRIEREQFFFDRLRSFLLKSSAFYCTQARFSLLQRSLRQQYPQSARISTQLGVNEQPNVSVSVSGPPPPGPFSPDQLATFGFTHDQIATFSPEVLVAVLLRCADRPLRSRISTNRIGSLACTSNSTSATTINDAPPASRPRVFGMPLEEYAAAAKEPIPLVVLSCVRLLSELGLQLQGLFRVSGAQTEIAELRTLFDRGVDPLAHANSSVNLYSVACLLKAYFRELGERGAPLFASSMFDELVTNADADRSASTARLAAIMIRLPRATFVTCRFLFAFLAHVAQHAATNMMDSYNLAICFAPTLLPVPRDRDPVRLQAYAIDVVQTCIEHHSTIFPPHVAGPLYERAPDAARLHDVATQTVLQDVHYELPIVPHRRPSLAPQADTDCDPELSDADADDDDGDAEWFDARVDYDYEARSEQECTLRKAEVVRVSKRVSEDWFEGVSQAHNGLIPAAYITVLRRSCPTADTGNSTSATTPAHTSPQKRDGAPPRFEAQLSLDESAIAARRTLADRTELRSSEVPIARERDSVPSVNGDTNGDVEPQWRTRDRSSASKPSLASSHSCSKRSLTSTSDSCSKPSLSQSESSRSVGSKRLSKQLPKSNASGSPPALRKASEPSDPGRLTLSIAPLGPLTSASQHSFDESLLIAVASRPNTLSAATTTTTNTTINTTANVTTVTATASVNASEALGIAARGTSTLSISFDEIQDDIDAALAEVMSGLESLERQQRDQLERDLNTSTTTTTMTIGTAERARGETALPISIQVPCGARSSLADMFATTDQPTLRRSPNTPVQGLIGAHAQPQQAAEGRVSPSTLPTFISRTKPAGCIGFASAGAQKNANVNVPVPVPVPGAVAVAANGGRSHEHHAGSKPRKHSRAAESARRRTTALTMPFTEQAATAQRN